jgi:hypothetical protein
MANEFFLSGNAAVGSLSELPDRSSRVPYSPDWFKHSRDGSAEYAITIQENCSKNPGRLVCIEEIQIISAEMLPLSAHR